MRAPGPPDPRKMGLGGFLSKLGGFSLNTRINAYLRCICVYLSCIPQNTRIKGVFHCIMAYYGRILLLNSSEVEYDAYLLCISVYLLVFNEYCVIHVRYALDTHLIRYLARRVTWDQGW